MLVSAVVCRTGALDDVDFVIKYSRVVVPLMLLMFIDIESLVKIRIVGSNH